MHSKILYSMEKDGGNENTNGEDVAGKPDYIEIEILADKRYTMHSSYNEQINFCFVYFFAIIIFSFF